MLFPAASRLPCRSLNASTCTSVVVPCLFAPYAIETGSEIDRAPPMTTSADALFGDASVTVRTAPTTAANIDGTAQRTHLLPRALLMHPPFSVAYLLDAGPMLTYLARPDRCGFGENPVAGAGLGRPHDGTLLTGLRRERLMEAPVY